MADVTVHNSPLRLTSNIRRFTVRLGLGAALIAVVVVAPVMRANAVSTFSAYSHTGVVEPRGIAVEGKYVWISDVGVGSGEAKIVRVDIATGATNDITSPLIVTPFDVVAGGRYVWVMDHGPIGGQPTLLRISEKSLKVQLAYSMPKTMQYLGGNIVLAGNDVWIPAISTLTRVNATNFASTTYRSSLFSTLEAHAVADSHDLLLYGPLKTATASSEGNLASVSLASGAVSMTNISGLHGPVTPLAFDGTNLWVGNGYGIERVNMTTHRVTSIVVPKGLVIQFPETDEAAFSHGYIYFDVSIPRGNHGVPGLLRVNISSGIVTVLTSSLLFDPTLLSSGSGSVWVINNPPVGTARQPILVRVS